MKNDLLEKLAALEHEQWAAWTQHLLAHQTPENLAKWQRQIQATYGDLTEDEKESDRIWARKALELIQAKAIDAGDILYEGKFLRVRHNKGWEYVERQKTSGIVAILAITEERKLILVEQLRPPLNKNVIEIPAGLAGDIVGAEDEALAEAAKRELLEETGYEAERMELLTEGPASAGLSTEVITFFKAHKLRKVSVGGGDASEKIQVHEVPLDGLKAWIDQKQKAGSLVDYKVFAALYFEPR